MGYRIEQAQAEFSKWSEGYDRDLLQSFFFNPTHKRLLDELTPADTRILDVGCGTGKFASRVLEKFPETSVWGIDLCHGMLEQGMHRVKHWQGRYQVAEANAERLPFADNSFDVVTCTHSFHHYPDQVRAAREMHRVLRPGGRLFISEGDRDRLWGWLIFDCIVVMLEGPVKHLTTWAFRDLYHEIGFSDVQHKRRGGILPFHITMGKAVKQPQQLRRSA